MSTLRSLVPHGRKLFQNWEAAKNPPIKVWFWLSVRLCICSKFYITTSLNLYVCILFLSMHCYFLTTVTAVLCDFDWLQSRMFHHEPSNYSLLHNKRYYTADIWQAYTKSTKLAYLFKLEYFNKYYNNKYYFNNSICSKFVCELYMMKWIFKPWWGWSELSQALNGCWKNKFDHMWDMDVMFWVVVVLTSNICVGIC